MIKIRYTGQYQKLHAKYIELIPDLRKEVDKRVIWFQKNPDDTRLDNHPLTKRLKGKWAFSITDDIRIVYEWRNKTTVRFLIIGPHDLVYRKN
ncbi:MAG: hypothetical protein UV59_C0005G0025 [Candidatus Gottesmanbacteria bacterium GW2011_GWA1_43_11]|uniref:Type II toxin-antitoxin system mRNA interferase toxin, RelE/StbE family n=1 Tax=Candidatus Gottesmanbacteria bacterium GW2011_GWA1_43_11 TaxID=1618436 RepID=A0A0G1CJV5_9BACT|nr:MAG: hypothetical protein UV59_C0005G0025 [Candidatus Gottesmanbacteria bacterium GW2011_GWA1_43_11]